MNIYDYLDRMYEDLQESNWDRVEAKYRELAESLSDKKAVNRIEKIDLAEYKKLLYEGLREAVELAESESAHAIFFEYDMDNNWTGHFCICPEYFPETEEDDDWASEWEEEVAGPDLLDFARIHHDHGGLGDNESQNGITLYLIARTVCTFGHCVDDLPPTHLAICIAFHDQEPIWRIKENEEG